MQPFADAGPHGFASQSAPMSLLITGHPLGNPRLDSQKHSKSGTAAAHHGYPVGAQSRRSSHSNPIVTDLLLALTLMVKSHCLTAIEGRVVPSRFLVQGGMLH